MNKPRLTLIKRLWNSLFQKKEETKPKTSKKRPHRNQRRHHRAAPKKEAPEQKAPEQKVRKPGKFRRRHKAKEAG